MNTNTKGVPFGTKQVAIVTPKMGYELEKVVVVNTADNSIIPSEIRKTADDPAQWECSFIQPAGHVSIKPIVKPILYSVTFDVSDEFNVVLVEHDSMAEIEIKAAVNEEEAEADVPNDVPSSEITENPSDFNQPQHFSNSDTVPVMDVGETEQPDVQNNKLDENTEEPRPAGAEPHEENNDSCVSEPADIEETPRVDSDNVGDNKETISAPESPQPVAENDSSEPVQTVEETGGEDTVPVEVPEEPNVVDTPEESEENHDVSFDADEFSDELEDVEPEIISQADYDKKCSIFWQWKDEYDARRCSEEEFMDIQKRHYEFLDKIHDGLIVIQ